MPVTLRTLTGKVDPTIELQLRDLVLATNAIEAMVRASSTVELTDRVAALTRQVEDLLHRLQRLELRVTALENAP